MLQPTSAILLTTFGARPFSIEEAALAGVSYQSLRYEVAQGRLKRFSRGVFSTRLLDDYLVKVKAAARLHPDAIVVGESAAALHGMWCPRPAGWGPIEMVAGKAHRQYKQARLLKRKIDKCDITTVDGIRCTTPSRTALDIAAKSTLPEGLVMIDSYGRLSNPTRKQTLDPAYRDQVRGELLATAARMRRLRGIDRARYAAALANPAAESAPESYARGLFILAGHPEPLVGCEIRGANGKTYYADLLWPQTRQIVEIDGAEKYEDRRDLVAEKRREDAIRAAGYPVRRIMAGDLWITGIGTTGRRAA